METPRSQNLDHLFDFSAPVMREVMDKLMRAAHSNASILILGEGGTGKSVLARIAHQASRRDDKPFVTVNCPSLSKELLESELFGHVKGSFTGAARDYWGKVKAAEGGTLFFDEIGELPMEIQPKLLRLFQEREYERVGETITRSANIRVIAATNCDLKQRVSTGAFREDLYFRLNVISLELPPLRERKEDLIRFAEYYLRHFAALFKREITGFSAEALACIRNHTWPGNLRELLHAVEHGVALARDDILVPGDFPDEIQPGRTIAPKSQINNLMAEGWLSLENLIEKYVRLVMEHTSTSNKAASILGIDKATLYRKRKRWGLPISSQIRKNALFQITSGPPSTNGNQLVSISEAGHRRSANSSVTRVNHL
jgi:NtrC-family two-component system response regulator AlgB